MENKSTEIQSAVVPSSIDKVTEKEKIDTLRTEYSEIKSIEDIYTQRTRTINRRQPICITI
jgi:hypothetical protein